MESRRNRGSGYPIALYCCALVVVGALALILAAQARTVVAVGEIAAPLTAPNVITGTVVWKETGEPAASIRVVAADPSTHEVVLEELTDQDGRYMMLIGVGTWLIEVPSGQGYFGYGQLVTVLPHEAYTLDFNISERPPDPPTATPEPTSTPVPTSEGAGASNGGATADVTGTRVASSANGNAPTPTASNPSTLPKSGAEPNGSPMWFMFMLLALAVSAFCLGLMILGRIERPAPESRQRKDRI